MSIGGMGSRATRTRILLIAALAALGVTMIAAGTASASNKAAAKACQKSGWEQLFNQSGNGFTSTDECTSYAAKGGVLAKLQVVFQHEAHCLGIPDAPVCLSAGVTGFGLQPSSQVVVGVEFGGVLSEIEPTTTPAGAIDTGPQFGEFCPTSATGAFARGTLESGKLIVSTFVTGPTSC